MSGFDNSELRAQQRLRELEAVASLGSWEWDMASDVVRWSDQLFEIFDLKPEQFDATFAGYLRRVHPADRDLARATIERALATGTGFETDYRILLPSGEERWIHSRGRVTVDTTGDAARLVGTCQDVTAQRRLFDLLVDHAAIDPLTGLLNRWIIVDRLRHAIERAERHPSPPAVLFIDLDGLKAVNDNLGHAAGDGVLREAAAAIVRSLRSCDSVGRFGGDEFLVICEDVSAAVEGQRIGHRIAGALRLTAGDDTAGIAVTASVGVTTASREEAVDVVIARADTAMYEAKHRGGGQVFSIDHPSP